MTIAFGMNAVLTSVRPYLSTPQLPQYQTDTWNAYFRWIPLGFSQGSFLTQIYLGNIDFIQLAQSFGGILVVLAIGLWLGNIALSKLNRVVYAEEKGVSLSDGIPEEDPARAGRLAQGL